METPIVKVKILGISGTPIKDGNCDKLVQTALKAAAGIPGVETEFITLADKKIAECKHCQWCVKNRARCNINDDVHAVHDKMFAADGIIMGGPTYCQVLSTQLQNVFFRGREEIFFGRRCVGKIGGALTLGWFGVGMEFAIKVIEQMMTSWGIVPVARGTAIVSTYWKGEKLKYQEGGAMDHPAGVFGAMLVGTTVAKNAQMMRYAKDAGVGQPPKV
jgi:multimeric flavodoxin WrbA